MNLIYEEVKSSEETLEEYRETVFNDAIENSTQIEFERKQPRSKKSKKSCKQLKFDEKPTNTPIKNAIIQQINARDLTYEDVKEYYAKLFGCCEEHDDVKDQVNKAAFNLINTFKDKPSMRAETISLFCDFLDLDILFVARKEHDEIESAALDLIVALKNDPTRLEETLELIRNKVNRKDDGLEN